MFCVASGNRTIYVRTNTIYYYIGFSAPKIEYGTGCLNSCLGIVVVFVQTCSMSSFISVKLLKRLNKDCRETGSPQSQPVPVQIDGF